jgi:hypothetical protein
MEENGQDSTKEYTAPVNSQPAPLRCAVQGDAKGGEGQLWDNRHRRGTVMLAVSAATTAYALAGMRAATGPPSSIA